MKTLVCILAVIAFAPWAQAQVDLESLSTDIKNTGFEKPDILSNAHEGAEPENWFYFCSVEGTSAGVTMKKKKTGSQSLLLQAPPATDAHRGFAQRFKAMPGFPYTFSVQVMNNANDPIVDTAYGQISIEWQNAAGSEITRSFGPTWSASLSPSQWEKFTMEDTAPDHAAVGIVVITFFSKESNGVGSFFVDDVDLKRGAFKKE